MIGPDGKFYQTAGHHSFVTLENSKFGASNPTVYVEVIGNHTGYSPAAFATALAQATQL